MSPPSFNSVEGISQDEARYVDGLKGASIPAVSASIGLGTKSITDEFKKLSLKPPSETRKVKPNEDICEEVGRLEEPMFFQIENLKLNDLVDFAKKREAAPEKSYIKRISAVERKQNGKLIHINKKEIALFRYGDRVFAIDEKCPHAGGPLHLGDIESIGHANILCVVCPWHKWKIELTTGKLKVPQRPKKTNIYPVKLSKDGDLLIGFHEFSPDYFMCNEDF